MPNLIPHFVYEQYQAHAVAGAFDAYVLFCDLSGFTVMTQTLAKHGKEGAEALSGVLSQVFDPLINAVYSFGGEVMTFAGDAFTAVFSAEAADALQRAVNWAAWAHAYIQSRPVSHTDYGDFQLGLKIGLAYGSVEWHILGEGRRYVYLFHGPAMAGSAQVIHLAQRGHTVAPVELADALDGIVSLRTYETHLVLNGDTDAKALPTAVVPVLTAAQMYPFVPDAVLNSHIPAEFRQVATIFLSFTASQRIATLTPFIEALLDMVTDYGGRLVEVDFGDKGPLAVLIFGAPLSHENDLRRAADFLLALKVLKTDVNWRAALTYGTVYAGFIGGQQRQHYTTLGSIMNLAARLVMQAAWGDTWVGPAAARDLHTLGYQLQDLGSFDLRGFSQAVQTFALVARHTYGSMERPTHSSHEMVGRDRELATLIDATAPIFAGQMAGVIVIEGEAGIGKSRLCETLLQRLLARHSVSWFTCPADAIRRSAFAPLRAFLRLYFNQQSRNSPTDNEANFRRSLDRLKDLVERMGHPQLAAELERTHSFLGALVDLYWPGSLYEQVENNMRLNNILDAFKALIQAESVRRPVVLHVEDAHWLDTETGLALTELLRSTPEYPFIVLVTQRPPHTDADSSPPSPRLNIDPYVQRVDLSLDTLDAPALRQLASRVLTGEVAPALVDFLRQKTNGNPLFAEQLTLHLREQRALRLEADGWTVASELVSVPREVNSLLVARLDRLTARARYVVHMAAVLGTVFDRAVLETMLHANGATDSPPLAPVIDQIVAAGIWHDAGETTFAFHHALMQTAAYDMQSRAHLRKQHAHAARAIEAHHGGENVAQYAELAYHYGRAADADRERHYAALAGEHAVETFASTDAIRYLTRALELTDDPAARYPLLRLRYRVHMYSSNRPAVEADLAELLALAETFDSPLRRAEVMTHYAHAMHNFGDITAMATWTPKAVEAARRAEEPEALARALIAATIPTFNGGQFDEATALLDEAEGIAQEAEHVEVEAAVYQIRLLLLRTQARMEEALVAARRFEELSRATNNRRNVLSALFNQGSLTAMIGDIPTAMTMLEAALTESEAIGDVIFRNAILPTLGATHMSLGHYERARELLAHAIAINEQAGTQTHGLSAQHNLGTLEVQFMGLTESGIAHLQKAREIARTLGQPRMEIKALAAQGSGYVIGEDPAAALVVAQEALALAQSTGMQGEEKLCLLAIGYAHEIAERTGEARTAYTDAHRLSVELKETHLLADPLAGLARVELADGEVSAAQAHIEQLLEIKAKYGFTDIINEAWLYLTCVRVLAAADDPRAADLLAEGRERLQERINGFNDPALRDIYLNIRFHRELLSDNIDRQRNTPA